VKNKALLAYITQCIVCGEGEKFNGIGKHYANGSPAAASRNKLNDFKPQRAYPMLYVVLRKLNFRRMRDYDN